MPLNRGYNASMSVNVHHPNPASHTPSAPPRWDVDRIRRDFPILSTTSHGKPLVYLDNAATTQKPRAVIDAVVKYYESQNANIHRGVYGLSQTATTLYEQTREKVRAFLNANEPAEIIFTRGTTEGINLVAATWGRQNPQTRRRSRRQPPRTPLRHRPLADGLRSQPARLLRVIPINEAGELQLDALATFLASGHVKMVAVNHVSNSLGTINPVKEITRMAHAAGARILIDGAQWVAHGPTDVRDLDADFYVFSGHKLIGPTGIGVLYGKRELLDAMPPYQGGGDMIASVTFEKTLYAELPNKFEAGTPDIAGVAGLAAAIDYLLALDLEKIGAHEHTLLDYATTQLLTIPGLRVIGTAKNKAAVISFVVEGLSTLDIGVGLDREGICVRTGHHCCQPVMDHYGISSTARASFSFYNTRGEVDALVAALKNLVASKLPRTAPPKEDQPVEYPRATAKNVRAAADKLAESFEFLGERDAKNEYVMDLAKTQPHLFDMLQKVTTRIPGCMSQVYLVGAKTAEFRRHS